MVADAEQAIRFVRSHAQQYAISPSRVGMIGFSAGAMATIEVALAKDGGARPDFAAAMYGAAPDSVRCRRPVRRRCSSPPRKTTRSCQPPTAPRSSSGGPRRAKRQLHIYEKGGHGFGFRHHNVPADNWPASFQAWLASHGFLTPPHRK